MAGAGAHVRNWGGTLRRLLSQLLMPLLSLLGVLAMMLFLSPRLTLTAVVAVVLSVGLTAWHTVKSQPKFTEQWRATGAPYGEIEEDYTGHTLINVVRHQAAACAQFDHDNAALYTSSYGAQALSQLPGMTGSTQSGLASTQRVFEFLDAPELSAVAVQPGQTVAIVGPTGADKTTLMNLLPRFYEVDAGCIRLDDVDIRRMTRKALRGHLGVVPQDTWLFAGGIHDNVAYGRPGPTPATAAEVLAAATACPVDELVRGLPGGYETQIDENGVGSSAGQQQLLTIARAFIAHRLSTIQGADVIAYRDGSNVVEQGSRAVLMAAKRRYRAVYVSQFSNEPMAA